MSKNNQQLEPGCKVIAFPGNKIQIVLTPRILGRGQYGQVHYGYLRDNPNKYYAVKVIDRKRIRGKNHELLVNEIEIMTEIQHRHVCSLIAGTKTQTNYYLVMEHCNGGDVDGFIKARNGHLCELEARLILKQLVLGLMAIKAQNVMHRDLKLNNVLMNFPHLTKEQILAPDFNLKQVVRDVVIAPGGSTEPTEFQVKIADLGFARKLEEGQLAATRLGTPLVMAPEVLDGNKYDHAADVWSLGCIFYEMLTGYAPFTGTSQANLAENIAKGTYHFPKTLRFSLQGLSFLNSCLQYDHTLRPSLNELMNHPYIALDDSLEASTEQDLFLSFHPQTRQFRPDANPLNDGAACDATANITHAEVLSQPNVYAWMRQNPDQVISLSVHGNHQYEKVVLDRLMKLEAKRQREEEEAKEKRLAEEAAHPFPELSDEEANEEIKQQMASVEREREAAVQQEELKYSDFDPNLAGDKELVETDYMIPVQAEITQSRFAAAHRLIDDDDDDACFHSAMDSTQRILAQQNNQNLLKQGSEPKPSADAFDTHTVDNRFAEIQLNSDLMEEAKQLAQQKADSRALTASRVRSQQEEAQQIRNSDQLLFGSKEEDESTRKQAVINEFVQQSAMQASVVDIQRDPSFQLATNATEVLVENRTPGRQGFPLTLANLEIQRNYF